MYLHGMEQKLQNVVLLQQTTKFWGGLLEFDKIGFTITPMCKNTKATPQTVFAHMLYENADPYILLEPGILM